MATISAKAIRAMRLQLGHSLKEAALMTHVTVRAWQMWEAGDRAMPGAAWELYALKSGFHPIYELKLKGKT